MTLQDLLSMKIKAANGEECSPDFRIAIQDDTSTYPHIIVHAIGHDSETLDFYVRRNQLLPYEEGLQNVLRAQ